MKAKQPKFLELARGDDLDNETAYTICQLIDTVGSEIKENWDWEWLEKPRRDYRVLIDQSILEPAWRLLAQKDWLSLQTVFDGSKKISTIAPLADLTKLETLVLQNNLICDLSPLAGLRKLRYLNCYSNRIKDLSPLSQAKALEDLTLDVNPIKSFDVLETLNLQKLSLSTNQLVRFAASCKRLPNLQNLGVHGDGSVNNLADLPEMPSLKTLSLSGAKDVTVIARFPSLRTLETRHGNFADLNGLEKLKGVTHLDLWTSKALSLRPLSALYALRSIRIHAPRVDDLSALARLPVLHEIYVGDDTKCNRPELAALRKSLSPWADEFKSSDKNVRPSLNIEIVDQETFDFYDTKASFGVKPGQCEDGMFRSEQIWLQRELIESVEAAGFKEGEQSDFFLTNMTRSFARSEGIAIYTLRGYESFREIVTAIQQVLCEIKTDWIVYLQSLVYEGPDIDELPEELEDFIVWVYPDKIVATEENTAIVRQILD